MLNRDNMKTSMFPTKSGFGVWDAIGPRGDDRMVADVNTAKGGRSKQSTENCNARAVNPKHKSL
jgi:hypothetical protein